ARYSLPPLSPPSSPPPPSTLSLHDALPISLWPHQLTLSATPIPRSLAMTYYADLDLSVIDELPPGRKPIQTKLVAEQRREQVVRSEEHTSELQSRFDLVCRLLLEKKKTPTA